MQMHVDLQVLIYDTLKKLLVKFFRVISFPCKISSDYQDCGYFTC